MNAPAEQDTWEVRVRPRLMPRFAWGAAIFVAAVHIVVAFLLKTRSTGVLFQTSDQVAFAGFGIIVAGALLLLTRPRLRAGPAGISVRNLFGDRLIPWPQVVGVSFPAGKRWARIELPADEYIPVVAIQAVDKERAVAAMATLRALLARYGAGDQPGPDRPPG